MITITRMCIVARGREPATERMNSSGAARI
jgi:hypothetical protein